MRTSKYAMLMLLILLIGKVAEADSVSLVKRSLTVRPNSNFSLEITIDGNDVFGIATDIIFDSNLIEYVGYSEGSFLSATCQAIIIVNDDKPDEIKIGASRLGRSCGGVTDKGILAKLNFRSKSLAGYTVVTFADNTLVPFSNGEGGSKPANWLDSAVYVKVPDNTEPVISLVSPIGSIPADATSALVKIKTGEWAECRYSRSAIAPFSSMRFLETQDNLEHSLLLGNVKDDLEIYIKCSDQTGNVNSSNLNVPIVHESDVTGPVVVSVDYDIDYKRNPQVKIIAETNESAYCKYAINQSANTFALMEEFDYSGAKTHIHSLVNVPQGQVYIYVQCQDDSGNLGERKNSYFVYSPPKPSAQSQSSGGGGGGGGGGGCFLRALE